MSAQLEIRRYSGGDRHLHDYSQILFPLQGSMQIAIEGRRDIVASSAIAVIPERHEHDFEPSRDCCMLVLNIEAAALPASLPAAIVTPVDPFLWRLFGLLGAELEADAGRAHDVARLALTALE